MFSSPVRNCNGFFRTRPPMVVFLICLISLAISTFSLAFYIEHNRTAINIDAKNNWVKLANYLTSQKLCIGETGSKNHGFVDEISVPMLATVDFSNDYKSYTNFEILYDLTDWKGDDCSNGNGKLTELKAKFVIPPQYNRTSHNQVCVILQGTRPHLPRYSEPICSPIYFTGNAAKFTSKCSGANANLKMEFEADANGENFAVFLNESDRRVIYLHLMWCSYILVFIIMVVLLYAIFHQHEEKPSNYW